eukprot:1169014-Amphidinium_carterae.2
MASSQRCAGTADFSAAFLQANHTSREVYVSQPPEGDPTLPEHALLRMMVEIYGSTAGPSSWRNTLVPYIKELVYCQFVYDPCLFILRPKGNQQASAMTTSTSETPLDSCYDTQHLMYDTG